MTGYNNNFDVILGIAAKDLVKKDLALAQSIDTSKTEVSEKTLNKVRRRIKNYDKTTWWSELPIACRRFVAAVLIVCTISFAMCLSVDAVRAEIVNAILEWYDKFVSVSYVTEITLPNTIEVYREPILQIAGTEKQVIMQGEMGHQIIYINTEGILICYNQDIITDNPKNFDSEHGCTKMNVRVKNYDAVLLIYDDGSSTITWHDNEYSYIIYSFTDQINSDTLIRIAESVQ